MPTEILPAINKADCFLIRPGHRISSAYLELVLNSHEVRRQVETLTRGTTRLRASSGAYKMVRIKVPPVPDQLKVVEHCQVARDVAMTAQACAADVARVWRSFHNRELTSDV